MFYVTYCKDEAEMQADTYNYDTLISYDMVFRQRE